MSATGTSPARGTDATTDGRKDRRVVADYGRRLSTETRAASKTTEFVAYLAMLAEMLIAGAITNASSDNHHDPFRADRVWLYATILTVGYMISRGIAKIGSRPRSGRNQERDAVLRPARAAAARPATVLQHAVAV